MGAFTTNGGTFTSDGSLGGIAILNPGNAQWDDGNAATCALLGGQLSNLLKVTNFQFTIPDDATITGVSVDVKRWAASLSAITDGSVKLVKAGSTIGDDKASASTWSTAPVTVIYGNSSDMWSLSLTPNDINDINFGCVISGSAALIATLSIDYVTVTIYYQGSNPVLTYARQGFSQWL